MRAFTLNARKMLKIQLFEITPEELIEKIVNELKASSIQQRAISQEFETYLTTIQLAELLDVSVGTINNWRKKNILNACQIGGRVYFRRSDIDKAMIDLNSPCHE